MTQPSIPQGTRDFGPDVVRKRNYIFMVIKEVFELYGFQPLETPAMENLDTLIGKYGDEGDKLIFKILNNGLDNSAKQDQARKDFENLLAGKNDKSITERALRYDLTIPFARYVAMNYGQLSFPFKRYQIQPVWRADRPQKGRYREFYQCDADVVGSNSLINEAELAGIYAEVFQLLGIPVVIKINHRKILGALAELCGAPQQVTNITMAIDKLDKIGLEKVLEELAQRDLGAEAIAIVQRYLSISGTNDQKIEEANKLFSSMPNGAQGLSDVKAILQLSADKTKDALSIDFTLARGLNYYTGTIFEIQAMGVKIGSIGGGGRYDDLTGLFGVPNVPGVGISFGVDRIYDVMEELKLFPVEVYSGTRVLFFNLGDKESVAAMKLAYLLRGKQISCEVYHEQAKFDKQFKYADKRNIPFIVIIGSTELENDTCTIKNLKTGEQVSIPAKEVVDYDFGRA